MRFAVTSNISREQPGLIVSLTVGLVFMVCQRLCIDVKDVLLRAVPAGDLLKYSVLLAMNQRTTF